MSKGKIKMFPIDEIRNELRKQGHEVGVDVSRKEICKILGINLRTSYKKICEFLKIKFRPGDHKGGWKNPKPVYIINIEDTSDFFTFSSESELWEELLFGDTPGASSGRNTLDEYIREGYICLYKGDRYVISRSLNETPIPNLERNPFNLFLIRQFLKECGHDINCMTNQKEICRLLRIDSKSTKKEICAHLGIVYTKKEGCGKGCKEKKPVKLTNVSDDTHVIVFESKNKASREIGINNGTIYNYIKKRVPVDYFGEKFLLSFL